MALNWTTSGYWREHLPPATADRPPGLTSTSRGHRLASRQTDRTRSLTRLMQADLELCMILRRTRRPKRRDCGILAPLFIADERRDEPDSERSGARPQPFASPPDSWERSRAISNWFVS